MFYIISYLLVFKKMEKYKKFKKYNRLKKCIYKKCKNVTESCIITIMCFDIVHHQ